MDYVSKEFVYAIKLFPRTIDLLFLKATKIGMGKKYLDG